jgi:hypothetical protein
MALVNCPECGETISSEARACPTCGKPAKAVINREKDSKQAQGCLLMVLGAMFGFLGFGFGPLGLLGLVLFLAGGVWAAINTRLK